MAEMGETLQKTPAVASWLCDYIERTLMFWPSCAQVTVEEGNVQTLLPAACLLQLAEIQEACCEFLKRQLDPSNCLGIRAFADTHSCRELLRIADKFTQHNFQEVRNYMFYFVLVLCSVSVHTEYEYLFST